MRPILLGLPVAVMLGCNTSTTLLPFPSLNGDWQLVFSGSNPATCVTIADGRVTALLSECIDPQPVISSTPVSITGNSVAFAYVLGGVRQTNAGLIAVEANYQYLGTMQVDGSVSLNRLDTTTLNGAVINVFNDAVIMTRR